MKRIAVGIVGPSDSVQYIISLTKDKYADLIPVAVIYDDAVEVPERVKQYDFQVDVWLFTAVVSYNFAKSAQVTTKPMFFLSHTGSSLLALLVEMAYVQKLPMKSMSFDMFTGREIEEAFADAKIPLCKYYVYDWDSTVIAREMTDFHYSLWQQGKITLAVTCFLNTYLDLKERGVPVFRIWPPRDKVYDMLNHVISSAQAERFKEGQIAILQIAIDDYDDMVREAISGYAVQRVELKLHKLLIQCVEEVKGSLVIHGNGQYTVYSTRGCVQAWTRDFSILPLYQELTRTLRISVSGGIGFGPTAYEADESAHRALSFARRSGKGQWMVVTDDHSVIGPLSSSAQLRFSFAGATDLGQELAKRLKMSTTTVNRLLAVIDKLDCDSVRADDLAFYLSITTRSARRILAVMVQEQLALVVGTEVLVKGRPRKLYQISLDKLALVAKGDS
jgi:hypothetical protein